MYIKQLLNSKDKTDLSNPQRIIRAIEIKQGVTEGQKPLDTSFFTPSYYFLNRGRQELYTRINQRVDQMLKDIREYKNS